MADERTLRDLAQEILDVQDSNDLFDLGERFCRMLARLKQLAPDVAKHNFHPLVVVWLERLSWVTYGSNSVIYSKAYDWVSEKVEAEDDRKPSNK